MSEIPNYIVAHPVSATSEPERPANVPADWKFVAAIADMDATALWVKPSEPPTGT